MILDMPETAHHIMLNREEANATVLQHLAPQTALLRDLANYGSNLVLRAFNSSPKQMADIVVCGVLLKQIVAMVDAAEVLLSSGCGHAAFLPTRSAFEASIYFDWILTGNSELKATRYVVANFRDERFWANLSTPSTPESAELARLMQERGLDLDINAKHPHLAANSSTHLAEVSRILAQPNLKAVDDEFTKVRGRKKHDPHWYAFDGLTSIRQIADKVGALTRV